MRNLTSDNQSGVHPRIMQAIVAANEGHEQSYGMDSFTKRAEKVFSQQLGECQVCFVFNGTAANVLALQAILKPYEAVICAETSHLHVDECAAPERFLGSKLFVVPTTNGKLTVEQIAPFVIRRGDQHFPQPRVISIANPTELGTLYSPQEVKTLADYAHKNGLLLHVDGARIVNAAAAQNVSLKALTSEAGVDALSFGGTKNGLMFGEAVVLFKPMSDFRYIRKQAMQLGSKGRFIAAQFLALFEDELWKKNALHAIEMAKLLAEKAGKVPNVRITQTVQGNAVFAIVPRHVVGPLSAFMHFYVWNEHTFEVRWMTSFDTTPEDIDAFVEKLKSLAA
jgi:threonine aldolase